jgi:hypothetical protein
MNKTILFTIATAVCAFPMLAQATDFIPISVTSVPEPSTIVSGAIMLVPIAYGIARSFRKNRK